MLPNNNSFFSLFILLKHKMYAFVLPGHDKATAGTKNADGENLGQFSVSGGRRNKCVITPANVGMVAETIERRNQNWYTPSSPLVVSTYIHPWIPSL